MYKKKKYTYTYKKKICVYSIIKYSSDSSVDPGVIYNKICKKLR